MDAFYASVEQRDDPALRGQPVLVGGTGGRGVVAAARYEARVVGARSAMPMARALRLCPKAICVRPRMAHYQAESRRIFAIFETFTPVIEGLSLDEAFLDVSASLTLFGPPAELGRQIKERIYEETGLRASVGIGPNKLVAKIASDLEKPAGLCVLFGDDIRARLDPPDGCQYRWPAGGSSRPSGDGSIGPLAGSTGCGLTGMSIRVDTVQPKRTEFPVDLTTFLILGVAALIVLSGYFLFNDMPMLGRSGSRRRR